MHKKWKVKLKSAFAIYSLIADKPLSFNICIFEIVHFLNLFPTAL